MNSQNQKFPLIAHTYFWLFFSLLGLLPLIFLYLLSDSLVATSLMWAMWAASLAWPLFMATVFWYGSRNCSSEKMPFQDGMLWITWSMITGWSTFSFCTVPPALLSAFLGATVVAIYGDLLKRPEYAPEKWSRIVAFFYRNRMRR